MTRLRDLGVSIGVLAPGPGNAISDVAGVVVGHAPIGSETGVTAVVPYPPDAGRRRLFLGRWSLDGDLPMTGHAVGEDFGTFSSPVTWVPGSAVGPAYSALIELGHRRDTGLTTAAGWPPLVVSAPAAGHAEIAARDAEAAVVAALAEAPDGLVQEGGVGIGRGLRAFGFRAGVGTASRLAGPHGSGWVAGGLVVCSGGNRQELRIDGRPIASRLSAAAGNALPGRAQAVVATNAPLLPHQLDRLAARAALGLARVGLLEAGSEQVGVLAFSTTNASGADGEGDILLMQTVDEPTLTTLARAASEALEEAVLNALVAASTEAHEGSPGEAFPLTGWSDAPADGGR